MAFDQDFTRFPKCLAEEIGINKKTIEDTFRRGNEAKLISLFKTKFYWVVGFGDTLRGRREQAKNMISPNLSTQPIVLVFIFALHVTRL